MLQFEKSLHAGIQNNFNSAGKMEKVVELKESSKFPRATPILLGNLLLDRYSTVGISSILLLYFNRKLNFDPSISTALFHTNELLGYSFTIIGAIIADSWFGLFHTILWMTLVFSIGCTILAVGAIEVLNLPTLLVFLSDAFQ